MDQILTWLEENNADEETPEEAVADEVALATGGIAESTKKAYDFFMRPEPKDVAGDIVVEPETGLRSRLMRIGMVRGAKDEDKNTLQVFLDPIPHIRIDAMRPLQGWYKAKTEPKGVRDRPCLLPDALVDTPSGPKMIADLTAGEVVYGYDLVRNRFTETVVEGIASSTKPEYLEVELEDGRVLKLTPEHLVYTKGRGWVEAQTLTEEDDILDLSPVDQGVEATRRLCGIYGLRNLLDGKIYVGSAKVIRQRTLRHFRRLEQKTHDNLHLQAAYNRGDRFKVVVLEQCSEEELVAREQFYIDFYDSMNPDRGYNKTIAGRTIPSEDGRRRIADSKRGKTLEEIWGPEKAGLHREMMKGQTGERNPNYGNRGSLHPNFGKTDVEILGVEAAQAKAVKGSRAHKGKILSAETREKISQAHEGKQLADEHKSAIGKGVRRYLDGVGPRSFKEIHGDHADEVRAKISSSLKEGGKMSLPRKPPKKCERCQGPTPNRSRRFCVPCGKIHRSEFMMGNKRGGSSEQETAQ